MDHGIESPEDRIRAGKPAEGVLRLRAFHQCGWVVIELVDDGAGISTECVLAKAIERDLVTPERQRLSASARSCSFFSSLDSPLQSR